MTLDLSLPKSEDLAMKIRQRNHGGWRQYNIKVYTNKQMLVGVYIDRGRVSDTPEFAENMISETP